MFTLSLIILIIGGVILSERLRSIQKRTRSLLHFTNLQADIMNFMMSDGYGLSNSDYKKARKIVEMNNTLVKIYSCQRPSLFHTKTFFNFLNHFAKPIYDLDKKVQALRPKNEKLKNIQNELAETFEWSVFYNTPLYVIALMLLSIFPVLISLFAYKRTREFHKWYKKIITERSKEYITNNYHLPNLVKV
jgi:hypothetical protein